MGRPLERKPVERSLLEKVPNIYYRNFYKGAKSPFLRCVVQEFTKSMLDGSIIGTNETTRPNLHDGQLELKVVL